MRKCRICQLAIAGAILSLMAHEGWALSATINTPSSGSTRSKTNTCPGSGDVAKSEFENILDWNCKFGFGTKPNGMWNPELEQVAGTFTAMNWTKTLDPVNVPMVGQWAVGNGDHVARVTVWRTNPDQSSFNETSSHSVTN